MFPRVEGGRQGLRRIQESSREGPPIFCGCIPVGGPSELGKGPWPPGHPTPHNPRPRGDVHKRHPWAEADKAGSSFDHPKNVSENLVSAEAAVAAAPGLPSNSVSLSSFSLQGLALPCTPLLPNAQWIPDIHTHTCVYTRVFTQPALGDRGFEVRGPAYSGIFFN